MRFLTALLLLVTICGQLVAAESLSGMTIDDLLKMEDLGRIVLTPDGRYVIYEHMPAYEASPNTGALYQTSESSVRAQIHVIDLATSREPRRLFPQEPSGGYWIGGLSPDGAKLAVYSLVNSTLRAGVFDLGSGRLVWFSFVPNYYWFSQRAVWISDEELVYPTVSPDDEPVGMYLQSMASRANRFWQKSFAGKEPSVTVLRSGTARYVQPDPQGSLVRVVARSGHTSELASGLFYNLRLSPNGRYLAALREGAPVQGVVDATPGRRTLTVFDLQSPAAESVPCEDCDVILGTPEWSADSSKLVFYARDVGARVDTAKFFEYVLRSRAPRIVNTQTLTCLRTTRAGGANGIGLGEGVAVYAKGPAERGAGTTGLIATDCRDSDNKGWFLFRDGRRPIFLLPHDGKPTPSHTFSASASFNAVRGGPVGKAADALFVLQHGDVWRLSKNGEARNVTHNRISAPIIGPWDSRLAQDEVRYTGEALPLRRTVLETQDSIVILNLETEAIQTLVRPERDARLAAVSEHGKVAIFRTDTNNGSRLTLSTLSGPELLVAINKHLASVSLPRSVSINYTFEGEQVTNCLLLPSDPEPGKRYPLIVNVYPVGAPSKQSCAQVSRSDLNFHPMDPQLFTAHGYAVLSAGAPELLGDAAAARHRSAVVLAAIDAASRAGYVDVDRVGVFGLSQGQHNALQILTETNRFRAAVVSNGMSDFISAYGDIPLASWWRSNEGPVTGDNAMRFEQPRPLNGWPGATPWTDAPSLLLNSPLAYVDRIETPLLIIHSDFDQFPLSQSAELFTALNRLKKTAEYAVYWGEGHGNLSPANIRDWWTRVLRWFDTWLLPDDARAQRVPK